MKIMRRGRECDNKQMRWKEEGRGMMRDEEWEEREAREKGK